MRSTSGIVRISPWVFWKWLATLPRRKQLPGLESAQLFLLAARSTFGEIGSFEAIHDPRARTHSRSFGGISYAPLMAVTAWSTVCMYRGEAHDAEGASKAAKRVESICIGHENEPDFQLQLAVAWSYTASAFFAYREFPTIFERLSVVLKGSPNIGRIAGACNSRLPEVGATLLTVYWQKKDLQQTQLSASRVEAIVKPYPNDRRFQLDLAETRVSLSVAFADISDYDKRGTNSRATGEDRRPIRRRPSISVALADIWRNVTTNWFIIPIGRLEEIAKSGPNLGKIPNGTKKYSSPLLLFGETSAQKRLCLIWHSR